jgi:hypothetical protein
MNSILGIDPGLDGALCIYNGEHVDILDMPTTERVVNGKAKRQIDAYQVGNWLDLNRGRIKRAVVEHVTSSPQMGVASAFSFGFSTGVIHGALAGNAIPLLTVRPQDWKSAFGLIRQPKDASRGAASRIAPAHSSLWPLKKHDGRAESFLLAVYGMRFLN